MLDILYTLIQLNGYISCGVVPVMFIYWVHRCHYSIVDIEDFVL